MSWSKGKVRKASDVVKQGETVEAVILQVNAAEHRISLGLAWVFIARGDPTGGMLPMFFFPTVDVLLGVGLAVALGVLAGIFPALQAMRLRGADALRRK